MDTKFSIFVTLFAISSHSCQDRSLNNKSHDAKIRVRENVYTDLWYLI